MKYQAEALDYAYDALEPFIDKLTMEIHHDKHYAGYVDKLNTALEKYEHLQSQPIVELLKNLNDLPAEICRPVKNNGGGSANHALFWKLLKKDVPVGGEIAKALAEKFGGFEEFQKQFTDASARLFGSGWSWLILNDGELEIITTPNQDTPLSVGQDPILLLDLWEHAYYLKYQNRRPAYIENFFQVINWEQVDKYYREAKNQ